MKKFSIDDRVSVEWFDALKEPCIQKCKGKVLQVKEGGLLVSFDTPQYGESGSWVHSKLCKRLIKPKPMYVHISILEIQNLLNDGKINCEVWQGEVDNPSYFTFKLIRTKK
jgi:hypothetical protein